MTIANWTGVAGVVCLYRVTGADREKAGKNRFWGALYGRLVTVRVAMVGTRCGLEEVLLSVCKKSWFSGGDDQTALSTCLLLRGWRSTFFHH